LTRYLQRRRTAAMEFDWRGEEEFNPIWLWSQMTKNIKNMCFC